MIDEKNNAVARAKVKVKGTDQNVLTDLEGRFTLTLVENQQYEIEISSIGYVTKIISDVSASKNKQEELQVVLAVNVKNLETITVRTSSKKESVNALIQFQKNTNTVAQVISAEAIKKSPDRNTGEVLKRVPGVSLQEGKYLIVRGLPDRYNQATLNGALMASTEPDRKTFSFDIFPSSIVDNIIINKAATPEMPGEFAGGLVQILTKDVPDKNFLEVSVGSGVNLQVLQNDFYKYKGGKWDFLGIDDGTRKLPSNFPTTVAINSGTNEANAAYGKQLSDVWSGSKSGKPVNSMLQVNGGFNKRISPTKAFGGVFSLNYNQQSKFAEIHRNNYDLQRLPLFDNNDKQYVTNTMAGALANFTFRSGSNKFSWKNTYNINAADQYTSRQQLDINGDVTTHLKSEELSFISNRLLNSQLIGEHAIEKLDLRIKWNGNFGQMRQDVPDLRRLKYTMDSNGDYYANVSSDGNPNNAGRFSSKLKENVYGGALDVAHSREIGGYMQQIKIGGLYQKKNRQFNSRGLSIVLKNNANFDLLYLPSDQIFAKENYGADKFLLDDKTVNADSYTASSNLVAGFVQLDNQFGSRLRAVWGARVESFKQQLGGYMLNTVINKATDVLPSASLTYKLTPSTNIRATASQTVSRPEFRELSQFSFYDFARNGAVTGNAKLVRCKITNADLRYELYPRSGELFTVGVFYKYFQNPIEMQYDIGQGSPLFGFWNAKSAINYGVEVDIRKRLDFINSALNEVTFFANGALIKSKITVPDGYLGEAERPMQGQSPYVVNTGLQYDKENWGTNVTVLFNVIGRRIAQIGNQNVPQIWENPRPLLDAQISQRLTSHASLKLSVTDILNRRGIFYWDLDGNGKYNTGKGADLPINQLKYGTNINLQFNYSF